MRTFTLISVAVLVLAGCSQSDKRFTERELTQMRVLEQLRGGSVTNAIEMLEADLARDIEQLRTVLKQSDPTNSYRGQIQGTLGQFEQYRARHPVTQP